MQKFACNNCGNAFSKSSADQLNCPACGSNSLAELPNNRKKRFWQDRIIIIAGIFFLVMLIVLFLLPGSSNRYDVYIEKMQDSCMFIINVKDGKREVNPDKFRFSSDNGKSWQKENIFRVDYSGIFTIKVLHRQDSAKIFTYKFPNPVNFTPSCKEMKKDLCDCKELQVLSVEVKEINRKQALIIHASQPACQKLYSVTGPDGPYSKDSIFYTGTATNFQIYIKSEKCDPEGYSMNPFHVAPPTASSVSPSQLTRMLNKFITNVDSPDRNKLMYSILDYFESPQTVVIINNDRDNPVKVYDYLQRLKTLGSTNNVRVLVTKTNSNSYNKINQLSITESSDE